MRVCVTGALVCRRCKVNKRAGAGLLPCWYQYLWIRERFLPQAQRHLREVTMERREWRHACIGQGLQLARIHSSRVLPVPVSAATDQSHLVRNFDANVRAPQSPLPLTEKSRSLKKTVQTIAATQSLRKPAAGTYERYLGCTGPKLPELPADWQGGDEMSGKYSASVHRLGLSLDDLGLGRRALIEYALFLRLARKQRAAARPHTRASPS